MDVAVRIVIDVRNSFMQVVGSVASFYSLSFHSFVVLSGVWVDIFRIFDMLFVTHVRLQTHSIFPPRFRVLSGECDHVNILFLTYDL